MPRTYREDSIDFAALEADIGALEPPRLTVQDLLDRVRPKLETMHKRGVQPEQMADALKKHGISVDPRKLANYIRTGSLVRSARKASKPAPRPQAAAPAGDTEAPATQDWLPVSDKEPASSS